MVRGKYKEFKIPISLVVMAITLFLFVLAVIDFFSLSTLPINFQSFITDLGGWIYYIFVLSLVGLLYSIYLFASTVVQRRKFEELIYTDSKATFVKSTKDLDLISKKLGPSFRKRYENKKEQLRVR
ncbi:MAG: DUF3198 domain-containing protein [Thermoplasmatales archaeon]|nr:DUF3198 domain-containing protein [Candidatus Thermoplasmatota archaeon]MCL6002714.1 DUF3198 domain-containing protein [Candidatus Thermoplasmatota archaeon]MDA8054705.1 DUF3198 domain-containing protein [Thermoplasmatales archaeon]